MPSARTAVVEKITSARELLAINMIRLRKSLGWSQDALALESGLHRTFIAHVERQKRNISLDNVERIALAMDVPVRELFAPLMASKGR